MMGSFQSGLINMTSCLSLLYVEDDFKQSLVIQEKFLEPLKFRRLEVKRDGKSALQAYKDERFDIVMTDFDLPFMDGVELIRRIQEINKNQQFIMSTVHVGMEVVKSMQRTETSIITLPKEKIDLFLEGKIDDRLIFEIIARAVVFAQK